MATATRPKKSKTKGIQKTKSFKEFLNTGHRKKIAFVLLAAIIGVGVYMLFFASAATYNCQVENNVQICDVDQTAGTADTVLSLYGEAEHLANQGWGRYYGAAFRAPTSAYNGAVPVHRLNNGSASWHEFTTDDQKGQKEAAAGGAANLVYEGVSFFAWTDARQPGTVPVYRITRGGTGTQSMFSTDKAWVDKMLASGVWQADVTMPLLAFYAYPPNYAVAAVVNPYDCSILVNFESPRCAQAAESLFTNIEAGVVTASTECPKSWTDWNKNVNPGQFDKACQDTWNNYGKDCKNSEILASDRCKNERKAAEEASKAAIKAREESNKAAVVATTKKQDPIEAVNKVIVAQDNASKSNTSNTTAAAPATINNTSIAPKTNPCEGQKGPSLANCQKATQQPAPAPAPAAASPTSKSQPRSITEVESDSKASGEWTPKGICTITWKMDKYMFVFGASNGVKVFKDATSAYCDNRFQYLKIDKDSAGRKHYDWKKTWKQN